MTNINRVEIFRTLAEEDEYDALAEEMGHLVAMVDTWNQSLTTPRRLRAKQTTSPLLTDFESGWRTRSAAASRSASS